MAVKFEKLKVGMTLYDVRRNTGMSRQKWNIWHAQVIEIDAEKRLALVSWNGNAARWIDQDSINRYRASLPKDANADKY